MKRNTSAGVMVLLVKVEKAARHVPDFGKFKNGGSKK